jgi:hypothetical protein
MAQDVAQDVDDLRSDYATILATLKRERRMRDHVLRGQARTQGTAEIDRAIAALQRLGLAVGAREEAKQLNLLKEYADAT